MVPAEKMASGLGLSPRVLVSILNFDRADETIACLRSVERLESGAPEVLVVDNGSNDNSAGRIREAFPGVEVLALQRNLGFGGGHNRALEMALERGYDYVWLLNNDAQPDPQALTALLATARSWPGAGLIASVVLDRDDRKTVQYGGGRLHLGRGVASRTTRLPAAVAEVSFACACSLLVDLRLVRDVGPMREDYFLYFEDVEWSARAAARGWTMLVTPQSRVFHASKGVRKPPYADYYDLRNGLLFIHDVVKGPQRVLAHAFFGLRFLRKILRLILAGDSDRLGHLGLVWRGLGDGMARRRGPLSPAVCQASKG